MATEPDWEKERENTHTHTHMYMYINIYVCIYVCVFFLKLYLYIFRETERFRERNVNVWLSLACMALLGTWPATQANALTGNQTRDPLVHRLTLSPLSHTSQG